MQAQLQTEPSAGIPFAIPRKKPTAEDLAATLAAPWRHPPAALDAEPEGHAAGVLYVAPDGEVLLLRRSNAEANYAGHWALPGGNVEDGEEPLAGALREAGEEVGRRPGRDRPKLLDRRATPTGMAFHTFAVPVDEKFEPKLDYEHDAHEWAPLDRLPEPMHPAVMATLRERVGVGEDMSPEDWSGLREGLAKWLAEEEAEGEHAEDVRPDLVASDSALTMALDRDSVREVDRDGRLRVSTANISKACVNPYKGHEIPNWEELGLDPNRVYELLRDPEELEKAAPTFNGLQILRKHVPVNADDHQPWDVVGATGTSAKFEAPYLRNGLTIWTRGARHGIDSDEAKELSCGYHYRAEMTPGFFDGKRYDGVMRDIVGNHVALVKDGRAGPDVVVGDSTEALMSDANNALARKVNAIAHRTTSVAALHTYLKPRMAMDAKAPIMGRIFEGVTGKNFKDKKPEIAKRVRAAAKGKLAQDASLDDVEKVLDMLDSHELDAGDESVSEAQHNAMEAAAHGQSELGIPKKVAEEFVSKDNDLPAFLKSKGMGEDDIATVMGMTKKPATDAEPESDEEKKKREDEEKAKAAKDAAMKDTVTKPAMDAAIDAATKATEARVVKAQRDIRQAENAIRPYVGELSPALAFDSAEGVYRHALKILGVAGHDTIHASALPTILEMQPKAGARPTERGEALAMDASQAEAITKRFPGISRIKQA